MLLLARTYGYTDREYDLAGCVLDAFSRFSVDAVIKIPYFTQLSEEDQLEVCLEIISR